VDRGDERRQAVSEAAVSVFTDVVQVSAYLARCECGLEELAASRDAAEQLLVDHILDEHREVDAWPPGDGPVNPMFGG
jgi:hypothetical protein